MPKEITIVVEEVQEARLGEHYRYFAVQDIKQSDLSDAETLQVLEDAIESITSRG